MLGEVAVAVMQAHLCLPGAGGGLGSFDRSSGCVAVVPGGLDQQPAGVAVAGFGDVAAMLLLAAGVLAGRDAQPRRELARVAEAREVADLSDQRERGQRLDATKRSQPVDLPRPTLVGGDLLELRVERRQLTIDASRWMSMCSSASCASGSSRH